MQINVEQSEKKEKKRSDNRLASTFFRNGLRSNLDLTSLADNKAGILISINGFILTVSVTASGLIIHSPAMTRAFVAIIVTSLISIILAVFALKPRRKEEIVPKDYLQEQFSLLYYQDMVHLSPPEYEKRVKAILKSARKTKEEMIHHLHILGSEIDKKYYWLKRAYLFFSAGLMVSAAMVINALLFVEKNAYYPLVSGKIFYKKGTFYNIFEPSGAVTLPDGRVLLVEDENSAKGLKLVEFDEEGKLVELGNLYVPKKYKKLFKRVDDLEGATADGSLVYLTTSFSPDRENKESPKRQKLLVFEYEDGAVKRAWVFNGLKASLQKRFPALFTRSPLLKSALNIEGLAYENESQRLWLGLRSPLQSQKAVLIAVENPREVLIKGAEPLFGEPLFLDLDGRGVRGLCYDDKRHGFWVLAGSVDERKGSFGLYFYDLRRHRLKRIKDAPDLGFAEGVTVVLRHSGAPALLIVDDNGKKPNKPATYYMINKGGL